MYDLNRFENGAVVTAADLVEAGLVKKTLDGVKVLGNGEVTKKLTVQAALSLLPQRRKSRQQEERPRWYKVFETLKAAWQVPELKKKLLYTAFIILLFRLGSSIPVPYIDIAQLSTYFDSCPAPRWV